MARVGWRERYADSPRASRSVRYQGHDIRAHVSADGTPWVVLVDIFRALGYTRNPRHLRKRLKNPADTMKVLAWVPNTATPEGGGGAMITAANPHGLKCMVRPSDVNYLALFVWFEVTGLQELREADENPTHSR